nr:MAG TPA: type I neck protein [Caudoviricetes sp.]
MARMDMSELHKFQAQLQQMTTQEKQKLYEDCLKELAARFLRKVIKRTPVISGHLRRGWSALLKDAIRVQKIGSTYRIELVNNTEYASYVEYGHRQTPGRFVPAIGKQLKESWVEGQFCMTLSAHEVESGASAILQRKIQRYFEEEINGK